MSDLTKFKPEDYMQKVKDRIKSSFVEMIPDDQWENMIKHEIDEFLKLRETSGYRKERTSNFSSMVQSQLQEFSKEKLKEYLSSPDFLTIWGNNGKPIIGNAVKKFIIENSGEILVNLIGSHMQQTLYNIKNNV